MIADSANQTSYSRVSNPPTSIHFGIRLHYHGDIIMSATSQPRWFWPSSETHVWGSGEAAGQEDGWEDPKVHHPSTRA
jgi:hypothetical protein